MVPTCPVEFPGIFLRENESRQQGFHHQMPSFPTPASALCESSPLLQPSAEWGSAILLHPPPTLFINNAVMSPSSKALGTCIVSLANRKIPTQALQMRAEGELGEHTCHRCGAARSVCLSGCLFVGLVRCICRLTNNGRVELFPLHKGDGSRRWKGNQHFLPVQRCQV